MPAGPLENTSHAAVVTKNILFYWIYNVHELIYRKGQESLEVRIAGETIELIHIIRNISVYSLRSSSP